MMKRGNGVKISRRKKSTPLLTTNLVLQVLTILGIGAVALNIVFFSTVQTSPSRAPVASRKLTGDNVGVGKDVPKRQVNPQGDIPQSTVKKGKNTDGSITGSGKDKVLQIFEEAGVQLGKDEIAELPSWDEVLERIGEPIVYNTQSCARFRSAIAGVDRNMGCSGIFNTGTNLVTQLLKENVSSDENVYSKMQSFAKIIFSWCGSLVKKLPV